MVKTARADAVRTAFVFLYLLKRHPGTGGEVLLADVQDGSAQFDPVTYMDIDRVWSTRPGQPAGQLVMHAIGMIGHFSLCRRADRACYCYWKGARIGSGCRGDR